MLGHKMGRCGCARRRHRPNSMTKEDLESPRRVVNVKNIKELRGIRKHGNEVRIGAAVTLDELDRHPKIRPFFPCWPRLPAVSPAPRMRNMGTVAGDPAGPRCWYYRNGSAFLGQG